MSKNLLQKISLILNPTPPIGGLEISETALRFSIIIKGKLQNFSTPVPQGVFETGELKDPEGLVTALRSLHKQILGRENKSHKIHVVASLPSGKTYTQVFNLPIMQPDAIPEAAVLNLQMISPIDISGAYLDWQVVGDLKTGGKEVLGAFVNSVIVEQFLTVLKSSGFEAVAVEFPSLALARLVKELSLGIDLSKPIILLNVSSEGVDFVVIRNGNLYFNYFASWRFMQKEEKKILYSAFKDVINRELQRVLSFSVSHWGETIENVLLLTPGMKEDITKLISEGFPTLKVGELKLKKFETILPEWFTSLSGALRGLLPRSEDTIISLERVGTEEGYARNQLMFFIGFWRNIIVTALIFIVIAFGTADVFLRSNESVYQNQLAALTGRSEAAEIKRIQDEAVKFNKIVALINQTRSEEVNWTPLLDKINDIATGGVTLNRVFFQSLAAPVLINGSSASQEKAIAFKQAMVAVPQFQEVNLPFSDISSLPSGGVSFNLTFKIKELIK